eukprot:Hpha_TRINITY_DN30949_c0_g1::TRINITY_DN30949_c0_g1_i1::g.112259::m.112259
MRQSGVLLVSCAAAAVLLLVFRATPGAPQQNQQQQQALLRRVQSLEHSLSARDQEITQLRRSFADNGKELNELKELWSGTAAQMRSGVAKTGTVRESPLTPIPVSRPRPSEATTQEQPDSPVVDSARGIGVGVPNRESLGFVDTFRQAAPEVAEIECPKVDAATGGDIPLEHLPRGKPTTVAQKYDRRASNCFKHGLWSSVALEDHRKIMDVIAQVTHMKREALLFDWGCGCGHKLQWFTRTHNTSGLGVDVSAKSLAYAKNETTRANNFCWADGSNLWWVPPNTFDVAFSFGSVFHLYNESLICKSYREMVKLVKPGGYVYNGWTAEDEFTNSALYKCLGTVEEVDTIEVFTEYYGSSSSLFKGIKTFPTKMKGYGLGNEINRKRMPGAKWRKLKPLSYSHLIRKKSE